MTIKRIVNDIRANRPMGKVRAVEDNDKDTAATLEGLIRNIWACSDADSAVDNAAEYQVAGGMGAWRIVTEYSEDTSWDQDIKIKGFRNPMCLYADPASQDPMKRDARYWFVTSKISKQSFEAKYGTKGAVDFEDGLFDDEDDWDDEEGDSIRIAEYWYKTPIVKHLALLSDGSTIDADEVDENRLVKVDENGQPQQLTVVKTRQVNSNKIQMVVMSGDRILEGPTDWAGTKFPFILVYGENVILDGKVIVVRADTVCQRRTASLQLQPHAGDGDDSPYPAVGRLGDACDGAGSYGNVGAGAQGTDAVPPVQPRSCHGWATP